MKSVIIKIIDKGIRKKAARLLISLANKVGSIHFIDVSDAKFADKESLKFPKVAQIETPEYGGVALVDSQGELIGGQRGMVLNAPLNDACTATVTFVIGGIHTDN